MELLFSQPIKYAFIFEMSSSTSGFACAEIEISHACRAYARWGRTIKMAVACTRPLSLRACKRHVVLARVIYHHLLSPTPLRSARSVQPTLELDRVLMDNPVPDGLLRKQAQLLFFVFCSGTRWLYYFCQQAFLSVILYYLHLPARTRTFFFLFSLFLRRIRNGGSDGNDGPFAILTPTKTPRIYSVETARPS